MTESKRCSKCKQILGVENFHKASTASGLQAWCIDCRAADKRAKRTEHPISVTEKRCFTCHRVKEAEHFGRRASNKDGLNGSCLTCVARYNRKNNIASGRTKKSNGKQKAFKP